jgi:hypothetical protein
VVDVAFGVNPDNPPELRERIWGRLATDLRPRHLQRIAHVESFDDLPAIDGSLFY